MTRITARFNPTATQHVPLWRDVRVLKLVGQFVFALVVLFVAFRLVNNVLDALESLGQVPDFRFWREDNFFQQPARFSISEGPGFSSTDSFGRAFAIGIINTLRAVVIGIVMATVLGVFIGVGRLSRNWLVRNIAGVYVEIFQNTPLLVQLIFIYRGVYLTLPLIQDAVAFPSAGFHGRILELALYLAAIVLGVTALWYLRGFFAAWRGQGARPSLDRVRGQTLGLLVVIAALAVLFLAIPENTLYLSSRGLVLPAFLPTDTFGNWAAFVGLGVLSAAFLWYVRSQYQQRSGEPGRPLLYAGVAFVFVVVAGWLVVGASPLGVDVPEPQIATLGDGREVIRRINGGETISPEYAAILTGLVLYTAAFIGEIVRAGIQAVPYGQIEAARAGGLSNVQTLQSVILPQSLRIIIPPLGNQYLNLTKNSSLATAIGFADLFALSKTVIHQSGQDVVMIITVMLTYLVASLSISSAMNWVNGRMKLKER